MLQIDAILRSPPDQTVDHDYLDASQIANLPTRIFYKKKAILTRHRFVKVLVRAHDKAITLEIIDNRGNWQIDALAVRVLKSELSLRGCESQEILNLFRHAGCEMRLHGATLPRGQAKPPGTMEEMARFYSTYTDMDLQGHFDRDSPDRDRIDWIVSRISRRTRVLDVGCNSGRFGEELMTSGSFVAGVDLSPSLVERARSKGIDARVAFAECLPFEDATFDTAICAELLEHVLRPEAVLGEIHRVLVPSGQLVGSVPHGAGDWGYQDIGHHDEHLRAYSPQALRAALASCGFNEIALSELAHGRELPQTIVFDCRSATS